MKKKNLTILSLIICFIVTVTVIGTAVTGFTTSLEEIERDINNKRDRESEISDQIDSIRQQKNSTEKTAAENEKELNRLREELYKEQSERDRALEQLNEMKKGLESLESNISEVQKQYDKSVSEFLERARLMYRYSDYSTLELIMESNNILDFSTRANLYKHMIDYDRNLLEDITSSYKDLQTKKELQAALANDSESVLREIDAMIEYLEASEENTLAKYESNLNKIDSLANQQKKLEAEEAELNARINSLLAESKKYKYEGGKFIWPVESWVRISDTFRFREIHPITGLPSFHEGIDISAYGGTPILAAAGGRVVVADYNDSSGNYIVIDHGGGVMTMYAHSSKLISKVGETVQRGQTIALVGTTGNSSGNHLHFEVRIDGNKVDPLTYLDIPSK